MKGGMVLRALLTSALVASCASSGTEANRPAMRTYRMGFSPVPPRLTIAEVLRTIDSVSRHSDAALMVVDVPWAALLADTTYPRLETPATAASDILIIILVQDIYS